MFRTRARTASRAQKNDMVSRTDPLPGRRPCERLDLPRSTCYYRPKRVPEADWERMRLIDECPLQRPFYGSRRLRDGLEDLGSDLSRKKVQRLMREMGLTALYPKRNLSQRPPAHQVYPYRLRGWVVDHPNPVWAADVTYCLVALLTDRSKYRTKPLRPIENPGAFRRGSRRCSGGSRVRGGRWT